MDEETQATAWAKETAEHTDPVVTAPDCGERGRSFSEEEMFQNGGWTRGDWLLEQRDSHQRLGYSTP